MDYEQKYKRALERAREYLEAENFTEMADVFPELSESEDERIRKAIIKSIEEDSSVYEQEVSKEQMLAWLEKQKEQNEESSKFELKTPEWVCGGWDDEYMINTVIGRYSLHAEVAKKHGDTHDYNLSKSMENWLRNVVKPLILEKQKEQKDYRKLYEDIAKSEWFKKAYEGKSLGGDDEQKPIQTSEEKEYIRTLKNLISGFIRDKQPEDVAYYQRVYDWLDGRHIEQKPNIEICPHSIKSKSYKEQKPVEWTELTWKDIVELEGIINNVHYEFRNGIGQESFGKEVLEKFREYKGEYLDEIEQKPVEGKEYSSPECGTTAGVWSEEDEEIREGVLSDLCALQDWIIRYDANWLANPALKNIDKRISWLKSLPMRCPKSSDNWKPSEDEERLINTSISFLKDFADKGYENAVECIDWLKSLRPQPQQEWSEEEKDKVVQYLHDRDGGMLWSKATEITRDILDMLRPSWKPTYEQLEALRKAVNKLADTEVADSVSLSILYDHLKELV